MTALRNKYTDQNVFRALADPSRRAILQRLAVGELTIAQVAEGFEMSRPAVKKHLGILQEGGLISVTIRGRERVNKLELEALTAIQSWLAFFDAYWDLKLEKMKTEIEKGQDNE